MIILAKSNLVFKFVLWIFASVPKIARCEHRRI
jgi:hypothetical protein